MDIDRGTAAWSQLDFNVEVDIWSSGRQVQPYMDLWEETVVRVHREVTEKHSSAGYLGTPVPVSDLFQRAEAESRVVNSALSSWLVSVACALDCARYLHTKSVAVRYRVLCNALNGGM